jgi:hypothetical protein
MRHTVRFFSPLAMVYYHCRRIDTHFHVVPDFCADEVAEAGVDLPGHETLSWSIEQARTQMRGLGIENAVLSIAALSTTVYSNDIMKGRKLAKRWTSFCA